MFLYFLIMYFSYKVLYKDQNKSKSLHKEEKTRDWEDVMCLWDKKGKCFLDDNVVYRRCVLMQACWVWIVLRIPLFCSFCRKVLIRKERSRASLSNRKSGSNYPWRVVNQKWVISIIGYSKAQVYSWIILLRALLCHLSESNAVDIDLLAVLSDDWSEYPINYHLLRSGLPMNAMGRAMGIHDRNFHFYLCSTKQPSQKLFALNTESLPSIS